MTGWGLWTWISVFILGPGALVIFIWFLRDAKRLIRQIGEREPD